jgi:2'-5' RNA ligase
VRKPAEMLRQRAQAFAYAALYARERHRPSRPVLLDLAGGPIHSTSVIRIPVELAAPLVEAVQMLPGAEQHYLYPAADLHLTVMNLDHVAAAALPETIANMNALLAETASFEVRLRGLGTSSRSIYAQAFDCSGSLSRLRRELRHVIGGREPMALRQLGFVNVARYLKPDVELLREAVHAARHLQFGGVQVTAVEIVRTDKVLSGEGTSVLSSVSLAGSR